MIFIKKSHERILKDNHIYFGIILSDVFAGTVINNIN